MPNDVFTSWKRTVFQYSNKFRTKTIHYNFVTNMSNEDVQNGRLLVEFLFDEAIALEWEKEKLTPRDLVSVSIMGGDLTYPITIPYHAYQSSSQQRMALLDHINRVQQSKREWMMGTALNISVTIVSSLEANGRNMKHHIMTKDHFQELTERQVMVQRDIHQILNRYLSLHGQPTEVPRADNLQWTESLSQWCIRHLDVNVLVLYQPRGFNTVYELKLKSRCNDVKNHIVMWWSEVEQCLYDIRDPQNMMGKNVALCLKCGGAYSKYRSHRCCFEQESICRSDRKRKAHFKCTEKEIKRKKSQYDPGQMEANCPGASLFQALQEV